jgi:hypothetical protein
MDMKRQERIDELFDRLRMNLEARDVRHAMGPENHNRAVEALNELAATFARHYHPLDPTTVR